MSHQTSLDTWMTSEWKSAISFRYPCSVSSCAISDRVSVVASLPDAACKRLCRKISLKHGSILAFGVCLFVFLKKWNHYWSAHTARLTPSLTFTHFLFPSPFFFSYSELVSKGQSLEHLFELHFLEKSSFVGKKRGASFLAVPFGLRDERALSGSD